MNVLSIIGAAGLCACFAYLGVVLASQICDTIVAFEDGPVAAVPSIWLIVGCAAILGGVVATRGASGPQLGLVAILCLCLCAVWYSDVRCGIVPDVFTLAPLFAVVAAALYFQQWSMIVSGAVVFVPFAVAALLSKGRGMGWGDVKLVALGGVLLGAQTAVLSFGMACAIAVAIAFMRNRRDQPIAFAPYLIVSIFLSTAVHGML